ncbi:hypothetical protein H310_07459 [Aphanomyces invadans]|uniref:Uncharacterized protein n=1 Tax=Aphanomyces invadans TaxID=157072 RepID=A0A024U196_9STRA|nr:hypothetical protein H310_07459 [Aphanomyces invadans]ETW00019.1 hypothetical protein H310_07459 [Aphanomyces invadans]|eukprot:XP_008871044.1 hypothetical protein H310_07459 [Aphanomyces invadans]
MKRRGTERSELWIVDAVTKVANEFSAATVDSVCSAMYSPADIAIFAWWLHRRGVATSCIQRILDGAGICAAYVQETHDILDGYAPMDEVYLRLRVPKAVQSSALTTHPCPASLTFECVSRDQGGVADARQSPLRCHRWLEFEILDTDQHVVLPRQDVCRMFRSCRDYRCHVLTIEDNQVLTNLHPGHEVVLHVRADSKGSSNYVKFASISLRFAATLTLFAGEENGEAHFPKHVPLAPLRETLSTSLEAPTASKALTLLDLDNEAAISGSIDITSVQVGLKDNWESVEVPLKPPPAAAMTEEWVDLAPSRPAQPKDRCVAAAAADSPTPCEDARLAPNQTKHPDEKCTVS